MRVMRRCLRRERKRMMEMKIKRELKRMIKNKRVKRKTRKL